MKLQYFGTAAAEGVPALFCDCPTCREARRLGGKNIRTRSQSLVDDTLLIDFPADTYWHITNFGVNLLDIQAIVNTHVHEDHFYGIEFWNIREPGYAHMPEDWKGLTLYAPKQAREIAGIHGGLDLKELHPKFKFVPVKAFVPFTEGKYTITPLKANHGTETPFNYLISDGEKTLFYAHDTGYFKDETWKYLEEQRPHIDLISLDCCFGGTPLNKYTSHMNLDQNLSVLKRLEEMGCIDEKTVKVVNHFSHNGENINYEDMKKLTEPLGILTSYDGMTVEF